MNVSRYLHTATLLPGGKVLVAGGSPATASAEIYDPGTGAWSNTGSMSRARAEHTATLLASGLVLVAGGETGTLTKVAEIYDPATGQWSDTGTMIAGRREHTATLLGSGEVLAAGGISGGYYSAELYEPASGTWIATGSMPHVHYKHTATLLPNGTVLVAGGGNQATAEIYDRSASGCGTITLSPTSLPGANIGVVYSQTITASGGTSPYTFAVTAGALPPGLSLSSNGVLAGTPTTFGTSSFTVTATDAIGCTGSKDYTIATCSNVTIDPPVLPDPTLGSPYSQTLTASGGTPPHTFFAGSGMPPGLTLSTGGVLSGTVTSSGTYTFSVYARDVNYCYGNRTYTMSICPVTVSPTSLPSGSVGTAYSQTITASGGSAPYVFTVTSGSLPPGLTLSAGGLLAGTPTTFGRYTFTITATDTVGCSGSRAYTISMCGTVVISPPTLPDGTVGVPYSQTLTGSGGTPPYAFFVSSGLPPGLSLASAGVLAGTPTTAGTYTFTVYARDANYCYVQHSYTIDICTIVLSPTTLPDGSVGVPYSQTLGATGGSAPYTFSVTAGALPLGLTLDPAGMIAGTPTLGATFGFTVTAQDTAGCSGSQAYVVTISGSPGPGQNLVLGEGLGQPNPNRVRVLRQNGTSTSVDFQAYPSGQWGVNVAGGNATAAAIEQVFTGPGPGAMFGPQVRAFASTGSPMAKINYFAYGTLKYGVNVASGDDDGDGYGEIVTGPGPGLVFGPQLRSWNYDNASIGAMAKVNFFAYGTFKYGVNPGTGDVDGDSIAELLSAPGPGVVFGPQVRGWNFDNAGLTTIGKINFSAFTTAQFGGNVASGDVDSDAFDEIACTPGPGPSIQPRFKGFNFDGAAIAALGGFDVVVNTTGYGGRVGVGDVTGDGRAELLAGEGRDASARATARSFHYTGSALIPLLSIDAFSGQNYGVNVASANLGL